MAYDNFEQNLVQGSRLINVFVELNSKYIVMHGLSTFMNVLTKLELCSHHELERIEAMCQTS